MAVPTIAPSSSHSSMGGASGLARPSIGLWSKNAERLAGVGRLGEALVDRRGRGARRAGRRPPRARRPPPSISSSGALGLHEAVQHAADGLGQPEQLGPPRRRLAARASSLASAAPSPASPAGRRLDGLVGRSRRRPRSSTTTGAWSDGCLPLRALRSMSAHSHAARPTTASRARGRCASRCPCGSCRPGSPTTSTGRSVSGNCSRNTSVSPQSSRRRSASRSGSLTWVASTNGGRVPHVDVGRGDVEVAAHAPSGAAGSAVASRWPDQPLEPAQLVLVVVVVERAAVRHVHAHHPHAAAGGGEQPGLGIVGLVVVGEARRRRRRGRPG